ncbi:hypothetical protein IT882_13175 [Microbacterium schleiferi]|uniref:HicA-like toxin n=1 Tax=Microbacterium schleiferi TaxID=69362 RepID=A0A7S8MWV8_9MICO|nr:hypothetical protein IT882_13175 [Microbacterium schleiferi]
MHKELKKIAKALEAQGFDLEVTSRGHLIVSRDGQKITTFAGTPSDGRSWKNSLAYARRAGFIWPR